MSQEKVSVGKSHGLPQEIDLPQISGTMIVEKFRNMRGESIVIKTPKSRFVSNRQYQQRWDAISPHANGAAGLGACLWSQSFGRCGGKKFLVRQPPHVIAIGLIPRRLERYGWQWTLRGEVRPHILQQTTWSTPTESSDFFHPLWVRVSL